MAHPRRFLVWIVGIALGGTVVGIGIGRWREVHGGCLRGVETQTASQLSSRLIECWQRRLMGRDPQLLDELLRYWRTAPEAQQRDLVEWACRTRELVERVNARQRLAHLVWSTALISSCERNDREAIAAMLARTAYLSVWTKKPLEYELLTRGPSEGGSLRLLALVAAHQMATSEGTRSVLVHALVHTTGIKAVDWCYDAPTLATVRRVLEKVGTKWRISETYYAAVSEGPVRWGDLDNATLLDSPPSP